MILVWISKVLSGFVLLILVPLTSYAITPSIPKRSFTHKERALLTKGLLKFGWSRKSLNSVLLDRRIYRILNSISANASYPHARLKAKGVRWDKYSKVLNSPAAEYRKWNSEYLLAYRKYGVDREIITAILLVETGYGSYLGEFNVAAVFASIYLDADHMIKYQKYNYRVKRNMVRLCEKKTWALEELNALLLMRKKYGVDILSLKGSYAGAFGLAQFLPTSYLKWAVSANSKTSPNLFKYSDAILSIAHYLKAHGYKKGAKRILNRQAIWEYNHSYKYVNKVLRISSKLNMDRSGILIGHYNRYQKSS